MSDNDKGMFAEIDAFTEADRLLLRDLHQREEARTEKVLMPTPEGLIVRGHERREIFEFHAEEVGTFLFDVRGIKDAIATGKIRAHMFKVPEVPEVYYQHVLENGGVEPDRLPKIQGPDLERPGVMVDWPNGYQTMIDGNHRLCRRYQLGMKTFRFIMVDVLDCVHWMCRPGDEKRFFGAVDRPGYTTLDVEIKKL